MRIPSLPCLILALALLPACSSARRSIDERAAGAESCARAQDEAPLVRQSATHERIAQDDASKRSVSKERVGQARDAQHYWSDGGAQVLSVDEGGGLAENRRLILNGYGYDRIQTPFLLDTGATGSMLSASSALGREVVLDECSRFRVGQGQRAHGHLGTLPELHFGTMSRSDVVVGVVARDHSLESPVNVLGMADFFHAQLEHQGGRWFLRSEANRLEPRPTGWTNVPMIVGSPLVALEDPRGRRVYGLIDTGATTSFAVSPAPHGAYRLPADNGTTALRIAVSQTIGWRGLNLHGHKVSVLIGMDALAAREGRFTFNQAVWSMAPE